MIQNPFAGGFCILSHSSVAGTRGYFTADNDPDLEKFIITSLIFRKPNDQSSAVLTDFPG